MDVEVLYYYSVSGDNFEDRVILEDVAVDASDEQLEKLAFESIAKKKGHKNPKVKRFTKTET